MAVLSQGIKERIVRGVIEDGFSQAETAQRLSVAESTVSRTMRAYRERGTVAPREYVRGPSPKLGGKRLEWLRQRVAESAFSSTYELTPLFDEAFPEVPFVARRSSDRSTASGCP